MTTRSRAKSRASSASSDSTARPANSIAVEPGDIRSILEHARPAVVRIDVEANGAAATGTGFIVDASGIIVTNAHVVEGQDEVMVHLADGSALTGDVLGADTRLDLAVVKVDKTGLPTLDLGDSDTLQVGDAVVAIGNALGLSEGSGATVTTGIISGLDRVVDVGNETLFNAIQTDAAINPGNSGGPLVDMNGNVIGINTAIASPETSNNVGFAISISSAKPIIEALRDGKQPQIAFLGVTSQPLTADSADELGVDQGAVVSDVASGSAAAKAGLQEGDVIVEVAGAKVDSVEDVASAVRKHAPGDEIDVVIVRDGNTPDAHGDPGRAAPGLLRPEQHSGNLPVRSTRAGRSGQLRTGARHGDGARRARRRSPAAWAREGRVHRPGRAALGDPPRVRRPAQHRRVPPAGHGPAAAPPGLRPAVPPQPGTRRPRRRARAPHPRMGPRRHRGVAQRIRPGIIEE